MNRQEFEEMELQVQQSDLPLKSYDTVPKSVSDKQ